MFGAATILAGCGAQEKFESVGADLGPTTAPTASTVPAPVLIPYVGEGFTILLPGPGELERETSTGADKFVYTTVTEKRSGHLFSITYFPRPRGFDQDLAARRMEVTGGTLADLRTISFKGFPGRDFRLAKVDATDGLRTQFQRSLLVKGRIYLVGARYPDGLTAPPDLFRQVVDSLTFT